MRIPTAAVPYVESAAGKTNEPDKAEPVSNASAAGYERWHASPEQTSNELADAPRQEPAPLAQGSRTPGQERRRGERRGENKPTLLDTRLTQVFRRKTEAPEIRMKA
jgi:hypothetical protein